MYMIGSVSMKKLNKSICLLILCFSFISFVSAKELRKTEIAEVNNALFVNIIKTSDGGYFGVGYNLPESKYAIPAQYAVKLDKSGNFVEDNVELATELGLKQAPTLVIYKGDVAEKIADLPSIKTFIESL